MFKTDSILVSPSTPGTKSIAADASGNLVFSDAFNPALNLSQLLGLRNISGVLEVGKTNAPYSTIQAAIDAIPVTASTTNPYVVVIAPGVYNETLTLTRDGVTLFALGQVTVSPSASSDTLTVSGAVRKLIIQGLHLANGFLGRACLRLIGGAGSNLLDQGLYAQGCFFSGSSPDGNYLVRANAVNYIHLENCHYTDNGAGLLQFNECAVKITGGDLPAIAYTHLSTNPRPAQPGLFEINAQSIGKTSMILTGFSFDSDSVTPVVVNADCYTAVSINGASTLTFKGRVLGDLTIDGTTSVYADKTPEGAITVSPTARFTPPSLSGNAVFVAADQVDVVFGFDLEGAYHPALTMTAQPANSETPFVSNVLSTGFRINFATNQTLSVKWFVYPLM